MKNSIKLLQTLLFLMILSHLFLSCEPESNEYNSLINSNIDLITEQAYPNQTGKLLQISLNRSQVTVENIGQDYILEGDIKVLLANNNKSVGRTGNRWLNNTVFYSIENGMPFTSRIIDAIAHWESITSLRFIKRTDQKDYIYFKNGSGCSSFVGRIGGRQDITLENGCSTGNTIHEIGHAIGLWHEQSRKDRNQYVNILFQNIEEGKEHNFRTYNEQGLDGNEYTSNLDFGSIMMYNSFAFSKNGQPTITRLNGDTYSAQRSGLSNADIAGINQMYPPILIDFKGVNGRFVSSEFGYQPMNCNRTVAQSWEKFEIIRLEGGKVAFKGDNGKYVSSENGLSAITCNRSEIGDWEQFTLVSIGGNKYVIKGNNGRYISSEDGRIPMTCNRVNIGSWEEFEISGL
ncbi:M12 family metallopeptidase [Aquimarina sp. Aq107]|uniref:M12 family metallopeptidase n=1 Tax=Aquimarina sp. Aq107 TaxID=1191912 RepID=UPI001F302A29|nr:M12 family metallopeptidase [Aquimarina sp. Aq107]